MSVSQTDDAGDTAAGFAFAFSAYFLWGFLPLYMKLMEHIPPVEIVTHRILWSIPVAAALLIALGRTRDIRDALTSPRVLAMGCVTALLLSLNWGIYIWAINSGNALDAALGYYINPLFSVFLGFALLKERLSKLQWGAVALAFVAVVILTLDAGRVPLAALGMTVTWGLYAFFKKWLPIGPNQGFLLEAIILAGPALIYLLIVESNGTGHFGENLWVLMGCGVVTAVPLLLYANGAKRLRLSTIAIMQYIAPTLIFLIAVFVFHEPFGQARAIAFPMIWAALVLYSVSMLGKRA
ncbi:MAG: EamA family transporter RarD [Pseudomonadota bacterium]